MNHSTSALNQVSKGPPDRPVLSQLSRAIIRRKRIMPCPFLATWEHHDKRKDQAAC